MLMRQHYLDSSQHGVDYKTKLHTVNINYPAMYITTCKVAPFKVQFLEQYTAVVWFAGLPLKGIGIESIHFKKTARS